MCGGVGGEHSAREQTRGWVMDARLVGYWPCVLCAISQAAFQAGFCHPPQLSRLDQRGATHGAGGQTFRWKELVKGASPILRLQGDGPLREEGRESWVS